MRTFFFLALIALMGTNAVAQKYLSSASHIRFYSDAPLEDIEATNEEARSVLDLTTNQIVATVPITGFQFEKKLMQEHFNENYLESDKYPQATLQAQLEGVDWDNPAKEVTAKGEMTIHGRTNEVDLKGTAVKNGDEIVVEAVFMIALQDYKIKIPKAVFYNIAESVEVTVKFTYQPYEN